MSQRIDFHPILGEPEKGPLVTFSYDGKPIEGYEGEPIAAALKAAGVMVVDGKPNVRTCITPVHAGMTVQTQYGVSAKPGAEAAE